MNLLTESVIFDIVFDSVLKTLSPVFCSINELSSEPAFFIVSLNKLNTSITKSMLLLIASFFSIHLSSHTIISAISATKPDSVSITFPIILDNFIKADPDTFSRFIIVLAMFAIIFPKAFIPLAMRIIFFANLSVNILLSIFDIALEDIIRFIRFFSSVPKSPAILRAEPANPVKLLRNRINTLAVEDMMFPPSFNTLNKPSNIFRILVIVPSDTFNRSVNALNLLVRSTNFSPVIGGITFLNACATGFTSFSICVNVCAKACIATSRPPASCQNSKIAFLAIPIGAIISTILSFTFVKSSFASSKSPIKYCQL